MTDPVHPAVLVTITGAGRVDQASTGRGDPLTPLLHLDPAALREPLARWHFDGDFAGTSRASRDKAWDSKYKDRYLRWADLLVKFLGEQSHD